MITMLVAADFVIAPPAGHAYTEFLWTWIDVAGFQPHIGFYLDALVAGDDPCGHLRRLLDSSLLG